MTKLSQIAFEAERLLGRMQEARRVALQQELVSLCEARWQAMRGPEPTTPLAHVLWSIIPPLADLYADLYSSGDAGLNDMLQGRRPAWGLALLVLAEIGRGNAEGAHQAYELMMAFESEKVGAQLAARMAALLQGEPGWPVMHRHARQPPLSKALAALVVRTGRCDLVAVLEIIRLLAASLATSDAALERLRAALETVGIRFLAAEEGQVRFLQHGHEHQPASFNDVAAALVAIRQMRIG